VTGAGVGGLQWVGACFLVWITYRGWKLLELARAEREQRLKGLLYGEALFHAVVVILIYVLLWSLGRR
jgi:threonine/homoserine/homoserine lactone efflux protein